jgi:peptidoglycan hydrolase CwlO-like protein
MEKLKKYWQIILGVVIAIIGAIFFMPNLSKKHKVKQLKNDIKNTEKEIKKVKQQNDELVEKRGNQIEEVNASKQKVAELEKKMAALKQRESDDVDAAKEHLKNLGK